ncbi:MAG: UMP kinase, partial [Spirochaetales bacterium]|nr:UMP kinase [Spirochaetales bacterium]
AFREAVCAYLEEDKERKLILVCGGGAPARDYQGALREVKPDSDSYIQDMLGIKATHLNGSLVRAIFADYCQNELVTDPTQDIEFKGRILVAAGWKPGFSTDTDAVYLAKKFGGKLIINLSNIAKVYTDDPRKNPNAQPLDNISWPDFITMVGTEWIPGKNTPFDPIASGLAKDAQLKVVCADGRNIENTIKILKGEDYIGTTIG